MTIAISQLDHLEPYMSIYSFGSRSEENWQPGSPGTAVPSCYGPAVLLKVCRFLYPSFGFPAVFFSECFFDRIGNIMHCLYLVEVSIFIIFVPKRSHDNQSYKLNLKLRRRLSGIPVAPFEKIKQCKSKFPRYAYIC